jgi:large subunit ribosomal protein L2
LRIIDFKRTKTDIAGIVESIEVDPNRNAKIALVRYEDGDKRYIIAPAGLKVGQKITNKMESNLEVGNNLPLGQIAIGTPIHNIEIKPGKGGQLVRGAGSVAHVQGKEDDWVLVKLPSGEIRRFDPKARATVGQVGNAESGKVRVRKAGINIKRGIRPAVRGVAMHPNAHPHGGGEGRSSVGLKYPKTPWGKKAVGNTRSKRKYSDKLIVSRRKLGRHH